MSLRSWRALWPLGALAGAVMVLALTGAIPTWPGLLHLVSLPPLDIFGDIRLLLMQPTSWPAFIAFAILLAVMRITILALLMGGLTKERVRTATMFYLAVVVPVGLCAFVVGAAQALLYVRVFWGALGLLAIVVVIFLSAPWQGAATLRSGLAQAWRHGLRVEITVPYILVIVGLGMLAERVPVLTIPLVPVAALATAAAIRLFARDPLPRPKLALAAAFGVFLILATVFVATRPWEQRAPLPQAQEGSLLIMSGINSASGQGAIFESQPELMGFTCDQTYYFSYSGPGDGQPRMRATCQIRTGALYEPHHTQRPFLEQVEAFVLQTEDLPRPLTVAAHSHAVWVAWEAIASGHAEVDNLILVGPFPEGVTGFQSADARGEGRIFGEFVRLAEPIPDLVDFHFDPNAPATEELLATTDTPNLILGRELPEETRTLSITSATDLPLIPGGWELDFVDANACPHRMAHPYLPLTGEFHRDIAGFLGGQEEYPCPAWRDWGGIAALAFGMPPGLGPTAEEKGAQLRYEPE